MEMLVVLALFALLSPIFAKLFFIFVNDVPQSYRIIDENSRLVNILGRMEEDIESAKGLPTNFEKYNSSQKVLLIESANAVICYELEDEQLTRRIISGGEVITNTWKMDKGKIAWHVWSRDSKNYAVEMESHIEQMVNGSLKKKMANNHVYFAALWPGAVR